MQADWKQAARQLRNGESRKISCCGKDRSAYISNTTQGLRIGPCMRCGFKDFEPHGERSVADILASRRLPAPSRVASIPASATPLYTSSVPSYARLFVLRAFFTPEEASDAHGFRYDPETRRVLVPIPSGYLSRRVDPGDRTSPKWIKYGASDVSFSLLGRRGGAVVVVEDIISGMAIDRAGTDALVILGTSPTDGACAALSRYSRVHCWTDGDKAGDAAYRKLRSRLGLYGLEVERIRTDEDPKHLHQDTIRRMLNDG